MLTWSLRVLKRLVVLAPGLAIAYFSVREVFPFVDHKLKLPDALSILVTYIIAAYVLIPGVLRVFRTLRPPKHLPLYCVTPDGFASDPLNIGIIATRRELILAMEQAGWYVADPHKLSYLLRHILSLIFGWAYPRAPVSNLYLFGRKQDLAFEIPIDGSPASRHHVRFWATTFDQKQKPLTIRGIHWYHRREHIQGAAKLLWVGAASLDVGINLIRHNLQFTHMIDPDTNKERGLVVDQLRDHKLVKKVETIRLGKPYKLINRVWRGSLHTDGNMAIVTLTQTRIKK